MINKDENYMPIYNEEEKNFHVKQGIYKNNSLIFAMIEDQIDHLITKRLMAFCAGNPALPLEKDQPIVYCRE